MRLRLIRPALKYFNSFLKCTRVTRTFPPLEYLAKAKAQKGEIEYWLVDGGHCFGNIFIRSIPRGRKPGIATHVDVALPQSTVYPALEPRILKLIARKAWQRGIDPMIIACPALQIRFPARDRAKRRKAYPYRATPEPRVSRQGSGIRVFVSAASATGTGRARSIRRRHRGEPGIRAACAVGC